jgi:hypothetical protein
MASLWVVATEVRARLTISLSFQVSHQVGRKAGLKAALHPKLHFKTKRGKASVGVAALPGASACKVWQEREAEKAFFGPL